ncbi:MAG: 30S ribosomal protein S3, partial [Dehalococcoidia bacterium]
INTSRPGVVIGRGGQRVDEVRNILQSLTGKKIQLNIQEIQVPECDAYLVARNIADQLEKGITYRRAVKRALSQTMNAGGKGIKVVVSGRLGGREIARRISEHQGSVPLHTLRADIDYGLAEAHADSGKIGVKVWVYKGDILPEHAYVEGENLEASTESAE